MRPDRDSVLMRTAELFALRSTCNRGQVGAVYSREGRILITAYNGAPPGLPHCTHDPIGKACDTATHAEANGIAWAARHGVKLGGVDVHVTMSPCYNCAKLLITAGVTRVIYRTHYRDASGISLLMDAEIAVEVMVEC